jgi:hypothetical protein
MLQYGACSGGTSSTGRYIGCGDDIIMFVVRCLWIDIFQQLSLNPCKKTA